MGMSADDLMQDRLPETTPADTPAPKTPTPTAPTGAPAKKWAGKYDTPEAMESAHLEAQRKISEQGERLSRLESLVMAGPEPQYVPPSPTPTPEVPEPSAWISREEASKIAEEKANARFQKWQEDQTRVASQNAAATRIRDDFFRYAPDLKDEVYAVYGATTEVINRYGEALSNPRWFAVNQPKVFEEIANSARSYIAKHKAAGKSEAEKAAQAQAGAQLPGSPGPVTPPGEKKAPTTDELRAEAMAESLERYNKTRRPPKG